MHLDPFTVATAVALAAGLWVGAVRYSRRTYPMLACRRCGGDGKKWEPRFLMILCLRWKRRAFGKCPACDGEPAIPRRRY